MARRRPTATRTPPLTPSITHDLLRLVSVTGHTALRDAQDVGTQLLTVARHTAQGARSATDGVAHDLAAVARRAGAGIGQGLQEITEDIARLGRMVRKPGATIASRRRTSVQRRPRRSGAKTAKAS